MRELSCGGIFFRARSGRPRLGGNWNLFSRCISEEAPRRSKISRCFAELRDDARIIKNGVPIEIGPENFEQRGAVPRRAAAIRDPMDSTGKRSAQRRQEHGPKHAAGLSQGIGQLV